MRALLRLISFVALALALAGCAAGEFSISGLPGSIEKEYRIEGSGFDESFTKAKRAMREAGFEIVNLNEEEGRITGQIDSVENSMGDVRTITRRSLQFEFSLERRGEGSLAFTVACGSNGVRCAERFLDLYSRYADFSEISGERERDGGQGVGSAEAGRSERITSEIRTGDSSLYEDPYDFSREEIIHIQAFLYRLGYDPGPADGTLNEKTRQAIEKFKAEYGIIEKLF